MRYVGVSIVLLSKASLWSPGHPSALVLKVWSGMCWLILRTKGIYCVTLVSTFINVIVVTKGLQGSKVSLLFTRDTFYANNINLGVEVFTES